MSKEPVIYLVVDASRDNADDDNYCDLALIPMAPAYVNDLLRYCTLVSFLRRADQLIYNMELWDATPLYFRDNEQLKSLKDIHGQPADDITWSKPILLSLDPEIPDEDFQRVECQTIQIGPNEIWWVGYIKHSNIRVETAHVHADVLEKIHKRFARRGKNCRKNDLSIRSGDGVQGISLESRKEGDCHV